MELHGEILASASGDGTIRLWHPGTGKLLNLLAGHSDFVESVAFSPKGYRPIVCLLEKSNEQLAISNGSSPR